MGRLYRTQILLEPNQHQALADIAQEKESSISELVREAVQTWLESYQTENALQHRLEAIEKIRKHHQEIIDSRGGDLLQFNAVGVLHQIREERGDELLTNTASDRD
jgi:Arc/MetJ-type ribon-helix-helix transcriptional regulator